jgi:hypothetical protein
MVAFVQPPARTMYNRFAPRLGRIEANECRRACGFRYRTPAIVKTFFQVLPN